MESQVGKALACCGTSNTWSTLDAVSAKISRKLGKNITPRELDDLMKKVGSEELMRNGVWRTSFGDKLMPIVLVNVTFARTVAETEGSVSCICGAVGKSRSEADSKRL